MCDANRLSFSTTMRLIDPLVFSSRPHLPKPQRTGQHDATQFLAYHVNGATEVNSLPYPIAGIKPSCWNAPRLSPSCQVSTAFPPARRKMEMIVTVIGLPVAGMPSVTLWYQGHIPATGVIYAELSGRGEPPVVVGGFPPRGPTVGPAVRSDDTNRIRPSSPDGQRKALLN